MLTRSPSIASRRARRASTGATRRRCAAEPRRRGRLDPGQQPRALPRPRARSTRRRGTASARRGGGRGRPPRRRRAPRPRPGSSRGANADLVERGPTGREEPKADANDQLVRLERGLVRAAEERACLDRSLRVQRLHVDRRVERDRRGCELGPRRGEGERPADRASTTGLLEAHDEPAPRAAAATIGDEPSSSRRCWRTSAPTCSSRRSPRSR